MMILNLRKMDMLTIVLIINNQLTWVSNKIEEGNVLIYHRNIHSMITNNH